MGRHGVLLLNKGLPILKASGQIPKLSLGWEDLDPLKGFQKKRGAPDKEILNTRTPGKEASKQLTCFFLKIFSRRSCMMDSILTFCRHSSRSGDVAN